MSSMPAVELMLMMRTLCMAGIFAVTEIKKTGRLTTTYIVSQPLTIKGTKQRNAGIRMRNFFVGVHGKPASSCSQRVSPFQSPCVNSSGVPLIQWKKINVSCEDGM